MAIDTRKIQGFSVFNPKPGPIPQSAELNNSAREAIKETRYSQKEAESIARRSAELSAAKKKLAAIIHPERKKKGPRSGTKRKMISDVFTDATHWEVLKNKIARRCNAPSDSPVLMLARVENHTCKPLFSIPTLFSAHRAIQLNKNSISKDEAHEDYVFRIELYALRAVFTDLQLMEEKFKLTHSS